MKVVLASGSPRRRELLRYIIEDFEVCSPDADESLIPGEDLHKAATRLAEVKGRSVISQFPDALIICADTIVAAKDASGEYNISLAKPSSEESAYKMVKKLNNQSHLVITGYCIFITKKGIVEIKHSNQVATEVSFANNSDSDLRNYASSGEPMDKAGAYGIQGRGGALIEKINGSYSNVVGLPLVELKRDLEQYIKLR